jgi:putative Mg2+ transporter-C (MgtC) family protein
VPLSTADIIIRLLSALACGAIIGLNRDFRGKPAGFRTFGMVGLGSALIVIVMHQVNGSGADAMSRVIQGVLTGIGFLGAGMILHRQHPAKVAGLTTAASVWLTAGLGMAAGAGQLTVTWIALALGLLLLIFGGPCEKLLERLLRRPGRRTSEKSSADSLPPQ